MVLVRKEKSRHVKNRGFKHYLSHVTVPDVAEGHLSIFNGLNHGLELFRCE